MTISKTIQERIIKAEANALATNGPHGINVVPISMVRVTDEALYVFDFFMGKTLENMAADPCVAMSFWFGLDGIQVKGEITMYNEGVEFDEGATWVREQNPDRITRHVIKITPKHVHDISAGPEAGKAIVVE